MTTDGKENKFEDIILDEEQAERITAGDSSAIYAFIEQNRRMLTLWAKKLIRNNPLFCNLEIDDIINQVFVDCPFYKFDEMKTLVNCLCRSIYHVPHGGFFRKTEDIIFFSSLDAPVEISARSGDKEGGATIGELLADKGPSPLEQLEQDEHIKEIMPLFYERLRAYYFNENNRTKKEKKEKGFQDLMEEIFVGYAYGDIEIYVKRQNNFKL